MKRFYRHDPLIWVLTDFKLTKMDQDRSVDPGDFDLEDPNLEEKLVNELKAQGIFDQFRKDCLSDVDTKVRILLSF